jgi:hypothetical protein
MSGLLGVLKCLLFIFKLQLSVLGLPLEIVNLLGFVLDCRHTAVLSVAN